MAENRELQLILRLKDEASKKLNKLADSAKKNEEGFKTLALAGSVATVGLIFGIKATINASNELASSLVGLNTVAEAFGQNSKVAKQAAIELASDGLLSVKSAANSLKNLLATGFSLPEAIELMKGFKDSAAFNRQGTLEFGQAIEGATAGLKNQNSIMVDNAGITKNLSIILKEAGFSQMDLMNVTSDATVRTALYNGILKETSIFQGDAAKSAELLQGKQAKLSTSVFNLKASVGDSLAPAIAKLIDLVNPFVNNLTKWIDNNKLLVAVVTGLALSVSLLATAVGGLGVALIVTKSAMISTIPIVRGLGLAVNSLLGPLGWTIIAVTTLSSILSSVLNKKFNESAEASNKLGVEADKMRQKLLDAREPISKVAEEIKKLGKEAQESADKIKALEEEITKSIEDNSKKQAGFKEDLAKTIIEQEDKVAGLKKAIQEKELEASKTAIRSSAHEELSILNAKLTEEVLALENVKKQKFDIENELIEMRRRTELTDFELKIENIQRSRIEDLKEFKNKLQMQLNELSALKMQHQQIESLEKEHTQVLNNEAEKRAKKEENVAQRILRARLSTMQLPGLQSTIPSPTSFLRSAVGGGSTIINNTFNGDVSGEEIVEKVGEALMNGLRFNQKL